jgi:hypothetical protein
MKSFERHSLKEIAAYLACVREVYLPVKFFAFYLLLLSFYAAATFHFKAFGVIFLAAIFTFGPRLFFSALGKQTSSVVESSIAIMIMGTLILGELTGFYEKLWWWDLPFHIMFGFILGHMAWSAIVHVYNPEKRTIEVATRALFIVFAILVSLGISGLWEIVEFFIDVVFRTNLQPGLVDTMHDLLAGLVGASFSGLFMESQ